MTKASRIILNEKFEFKQGLFEAHVKVLKIPKRDKFPDGFKLKCVLINVSYFCFHN